MTTTTMAATKGAHYTLGELAGALLNHTNGSTQLVRIAIGLTGANHTQTNNYEGKIGILMSMIIDDPAIQDYDIVKITITPIESTEPETKFSKPQSNEAKSSGLVNQILKSEVLGDIVGQVAGKAIQYGSEYLIDRLQTKSTGSTSTASETNQPKPQSTSTGLGLNALLEVMGHPSVKPTESKPTPTAESKFKSARDYAMGVVQLIMSSSDPKQRSEHQINYVIELIKGLSMTDSTDNCATKAKLIITGCKALCEQSGLHPSIKEITIPLLETYLTEFITYMDST